MKAEICALVSSDWQIRSVEDVCKRVTSGGTPSRTRPDFYVDGPWPWVKTQELQDTWIDHTEEKITEEAVANSSAKVLPPNTILLAMYGATVGQLGILRSPMTCNQACCAMIVDPEKADFRYLYHHLRYSRTQLKSLATGAAQQNLSGALIKSLLYPFPPLAEQKAIAAVLGALDDKIELNRRMNATLEAMARALFQSWFVDFDPVRAKLDGRQPVGMDAETAALFPASFDHQPKGVVPKDWERKRWGDIATLEYGKSIRDYRESFGKYRVFGTNGPIGYHDEVLCDGPGIVIGRKGAYRGVHFSPQPFFAIDTAFYLKPKEALDLKWAYYELLRFDINNMDSGSAIPSTSRDDFYGIPVIVPSPKVQDAFGQIVDRWFATIFANDKQSRTLATLRDTLLPRLLSGELRATDMELFVGHSAVVAER